jgi:hypothetical protein
MQGLKKREGFLGDVGPVMEFSAVTTNEREAQSRDRAEFAPPEPLKNKFAERRLMSAEEMRPAED